MGAFVTLTSKGQLTIPKEVRERLNLESGTQCYVMDRDGDVLIIPRNKKLADLVGILGEPPRGKGSTLEEIDETVRGAVGRHVLGLNEAEGE